MAQELSKAIARAVLDAVEGRCGTVVTATVVRSPAAAPVPLGAKLALLPDGSVLGGLGGGALEAAVLEDCCAAVAAHAVETHRYLPGGTPVVTPGSRETDTVDVLLEVVEPPVSLVIVGGGHIGRSLVKIGEHLGFSVTVIDDRPEYANRERFPEADRVICGDFAETLRQLPVTPSTYAVIVTRGHKQDEVSLRQLVGSPARYVGMIGSKRRVTAVFQHLVADGFPPEALAKVHSPIGLDIGAETPEEIALSIMAEIIQERRGGSGAPMSVQRPKRALRAPVGSPA